MNSQPQQPAHEHEIDSQTPPSAPLNTHSQELPAKIMQAAVEHDRKRMFIAGLRSFLSFAGFIATVVIAAMIINHFVFQSYYVDGSSMTPNLQNNDRLIIDKTGKTWAAIQGKAYVPQRGDIVVLDSSLLDRYGHDEQLIKRVIGLPGEIIHIADGVVTVKNLQQPNGFAVDSSLGLQLTPTYTSDALDITIPADSIFVLGDNRAPNGSFDSRSFGPVKADKIQGRLALRVFPFDKIKTY